MSASLLSLLAQQGGPALPTRKGLMLLGLQNDFLSASGKMAVDPAGAVRERLVPLVPDFRQHCTVIWVRMEYDPTTSPQTADSIIVPTTSSGPRPSSSRGSSKRKSSNASKRRPPSSQTNEPPANLDELFLNRQRQGGPCCQSGSWGAEYAPSIEPIVDRTRDLEVVTNHYSALRNPHVLQALRTRLITELYLAGCVTNSSIYATALDAAAYGIKIVLVDDCLAFRARPLHEVALQKLNRLIDAQPTRSTTLLEHWRQTGKNASEVSRAKAKSAASSIPTMNPSSFEVDSESDSESGSTSDSENDSDREEVALPYRSQRIATRRQHSSPSRPSSSQYQTYASISTSRTIGPVHRRIPSLPGAFALSNSSGLGNTSSADYATSTRTSVPDSGVRRSDVVRKSAQFRTRYQVASTAQPPSNTARRDSASTPPK